MPWLTRSTAVTILVLLAGYTLLLTVTFDLPGPSRIHTRLVVQEPRQKSGYSYGSSDGTRTDAGAVQNVGAKPQVSSESGSSKSKNAACGDKDERCEEWRRDGQCLANPGFMLQKCWKACGCCEWKPLSNVSSWVCDSPSRWLCNRPASAQIRRRRRRGS